MSGGGLRVLVKCFREFVFFSLSDRRRVLLRMTPLTSALPLVGSDSVARWIRCTPRVFFMSVTHVSGHHSMHSCLKITPSPTFLVFPQLDSFSLRFLSFHLLYVFFHICLPPIPLCPPSPRIHLSLTPALRSTCCSCQ